MLEAYFKLGLDDRVDGFIMTNIRHANIRTTPPPKTRLNQGPRALLRGCMKQWSLQVCIYLSTQLCMHVHTRVRS